MEVSGDSVAVGELLREGLIDFCPPCALLCFFRSADSGVVYWHWLHLLDTGQVSASGLARGGSPVTCQRPLDWQSRLVGDWQPHTSTLPLLKANSSYSQLAQVALFSVSQTPPTSVRPTDSNLQPPLPRILSSFLANNIWTPGVCSLLQASLLGLPPDGSQVQPPSSASSPPTIQIGPVPMTG